MARRGERRAGFSIPQGYVVEQGLQPWGTLQRRLLWTQWRRGHRGQLGQLPASPSRVKVSQDISSKQPIEVNQDFKESTRLKKVIELFCFPCVGLLLFAF